MTTSFRSDSETSGPETPGPDGQNQPEPPNLRLLRRLVTILMVVMICGFLVIVGLFVIRLSGPAKNTGTVTGPGLPDTITLPQGARAEAVTFGRDWIAIVSSDNRIMIYDKATGALKQTIDIK